MEAEGGGEGTSRSWEGEEGLCSAEKEAGVGPRWRLGELGQHRPSDGADRVTERAMQTE